MKAKSNVPVLAFGYVRVSGIGQVKGHGPQRQRELIEQFAARHKYHIADFFEDAHTGTEADRPRFVEMVARMMGNGVKTVVVESLDRLARDLFIQSTLLAKLAAEGLTLVAANTGEDVTAAMQDDPMRKAMVQIQGVFAELDKNLTVRKLRKARDAIRQERGHCEGPRPYGQDPERPGEAAVVAKMRQLKRVGKSLQKIADALNAEPTLYPTRTGAKWSKAAVFTVLGRKG